MRSNGQRFIVSVLAAVIAVLVRAPAFAQDLLATGYTIPATADKNEGVPGPVAVPDDGTLRLGLPLQYVDTGLTVIDLNTGLEWEKKNNQDDIQDLSNLHDADNVYVRSGDGTQETIWDWLDDVNAEQYAGPSDWRIPNVRELQSILHFEEMHPAIAPIFGPAAIHSHWSSTTQPNNPNRGFGVNFENGTKVVMGLTIAKWVRAVRDADVNQPPVGEANGPYSGNPNVAISFSSAGSNDPDGSIASYAWDFGDGTPLSTDPNPSHAYASAGSFTATLTVTDNQGATDTDTAAVTVVVDNQPPVGEANGPYSGNPNVAISFSSAGSNDPDGSIASYAWDFGDGTPLSTDPNPSHAYASAGSFTATLTVTDNQGATDTDTAEVTVDNPPPVNQPPVAEANGPYSGQVGSPITFSSADSNDPDGTITAYSWDFGDGSPPSTEQNPSHPYASAGSFTATLTVTDNQGATDTDTAEVTVIQVQISDLVETAVTNPPGSIKRGKRFSVTDTANNQGTATAGASTTRYYLSLDTAKDGGDQLLTGSRAIPSLAPGAQSSGTANVTVPTTTALGSYFLLACADDTQVVAENNETNNCKASATQVTVTP